MKELTSRAWLKVSAFILTVIFILLSCGGVVAIYCAIATGIYTTPQDSYKDAWFNSMIHNDMSDVMLLYANGEDNIYAPIRSENISYFEIKDHTTGEILSSYGEKDPSSRLYKGNYLLRTVYNSYSKMYFNEIYRVDTFGSEPAENEKYLSVSLSLLSPLTANDKYSFIGGFVDMAYSVRYALFPLTVFCLICSVIGFVYLMYASGRQRGTSEIRPGFGVKIPFDLFLVFVVGVFIFALYLLGEIGLLMEPQDIVILVIYITAGISTLLGLCMSVAARIKMNTLFKNTVIYIIIHFIYRVFRKIFSILKTFTLNLNLFIRTVGVLAVVFFADLLLTIIFRESFITVFLWFLLKFCEAFVILFCVFMFNRLSRGAHTLANGNLSEKIDTSNLILDFKKHANDLNSIADGMETAVNERLKSERMKTELITNVSHDIKTPLTSIINYSDLISKEKTENEKITEYSTVLQRQSQRLKRLIEDLVEASKASTGNLEMKLAPMSANVFVNQALAEYRDRLEERSLTLISSVTKTPTTVMCDGKRIWRIFDNLMNNICKYSQPNTRVYISLENTGSFARITFKNTSKEALNISPDELLERFTRGDSSRNTEGNGLGLSIAQSLTELQGGKMHIVTDGDLFKAILDFPIVPSVTA